MRIYILKSNPNIGILDYFFGLFFIRENRRFGTNLKSFFCIHHGRIFPNSNPIKNILNANGILKGKNLKMKIEPISHTFGSSGKDSHKKRTPGVRSAFLNSDIDRIKS